MKIIGTHLETIKDGGIVVFGQVSRLLVILTEVITSSYLVKIVGTHLETIKDGGIGVFGQFSRLLVTLTRLSF